jgi:Tol biopolymer transport system component
MSQDADIAQRSLRDILNDGESFGPEQAVRISIDVAGALHRIHKEGKIQGAIYPDQVLISMQGRAKLADLENSRSIEHLPLPDLCFVPPEKLDGQVLTQQTDIYGIGIILYVLLSGHLPFNGRTREALTEQILETQFEPLPAPYSSEGQMSWIIGKCTLRDKDLRFKSMQEVALELGKLIGLSPNMKQPPVEKPSITETRVSTTDSGVVGTELGHLAETRTAAPDANPAPRMAAPQVRRQQFQFSNVTEWLQKNWKIAAIAAAVLLAAMMTIVLWPEKKVPVVRVEGKPHLTRLSSERFFEQDPSLSPDNNILAFVSNRTGNWELFVRPAKGGASVQLSRSPGDEINPRWSPDGKEILYSYQEAGMPATLFTVPPTGGIPQKLASDAVHGQWSPDGKTICFAGPADKKSRSLYILAPATLQVQEVLKDQNGLAHPSFSPDAKEIVYEADQGDSHGLFILNLETEESRQITKDSLDYLPTWDWRSGDIYFSSKRDGTFKIWRVDGTGKMEKLTSGPGQDFRPVPSYKDSEVVFYRYKMATDISTVDPSSGNSNIESPSPDRSSYPRSISGNKSFCYLEEIENDLNLRWIPKGASYTEIILKSVPKQTAFNVSPDGSSLFVEYPEETAKGLWQVVLSEQTVAALGQSLLLPYEFSPDRKYLLFAVRNGDKVSYRLKDLKAQADSEIFSLPYANRISRAFWIDQGKSIVYATKDGKLLQWTMKTNQTDPVLGEKCYDFAVRSRTDQIVALVGNDFRNADLILYEPKKKSRRVLTTYHPNDYALHVDWAKDGSLIFTDRYKPDTNLYSLSLQ